MRSRRAPTPCGPTRFLTESDFRNQYRGVCIGMPIKERIKWALVSGLALGLILALTITIHILMDRVDVLTQPPMPLP